MNITIILKFKLIINFNKILNMLTEFPLPYDTSTVNLAFFDIVQFFYFIYFGLFLFLYNFLINVRIFNPKVWNTQAQDICHINVYVAPVFKKVFSKFMLYVLPHKYIGSIPKVAVIQPQMLRTILYQLHISYTLYCS